MASRALADARLYLCTPDRPDLPGFLDAVLSGGVDVVQLRQKGLEAREELALCRVVAEAAERYDALWSVNDRADLALLTSADVLHVGQGDLPPRLAAQVHDSYLIGQSTHDEEQVDAAIADPFVDYFCVGPVWATPTKPGRPAAGLDLVGYAAARAGARPWFAIGGIDAGNLDQVLEAGATRVVVVRALTKAADPHAAARALRERLP